MQWLIDMVIEAIGIPPTFIDRGDPDQPDYDVTELTKDATWHELDLSGIVPEGATAVTLSILIHAAAVQNQLYFRRAGNSEALNIAAITSTVVGLIQTNDFIVAVDENRKIEYNLTALNWNIIFITVKGWWK